MHTITRLKHLCRKQYHMRALLTLVLLLAVLGLAGILNLTGNMPVVHAAECDIFGVINTNRTLGTNAEGCDIYNTTGSIVVSQGVTLTIEPGTTLRFGSGDALTIRGTLIAQGTETSPITFTGPQTASPGSWGYIYFSSSSVGATFDNNGNYTGGSVIQYATIEGAGGSSVSDNAALRMDGVTPWIDHVTVRNSAVRGIRLFDLTTINTFYQMTNNTVESCAGGITIDSNGDNIRGVLSNNTITNNTAQSNDYNGGGFYIYARGDNSLITMNDNTITDNTAYAGGGVYISSYANATLSNNIITGNTADGDDGGGLYVTSSDVTLSNNTITGNTADDYGGGVYSQYTGITLENSTVTNNEATRYDGGGLYIWASGSADVVQIKNNSIQDNTTGDAGGGIAIYSGSNSPITFEGNTISGNTADREGGAIALQYSSNPTITENDITGNMTLSDTKAGIYICDSCIPTINNNNIYSNIGSGGTIDIYNNNGADEQDIDATNNYWNTTTASDIESRVFHGIDDSSLGLVNYTPFLSEPPATPTATATATATPSPSATATATATPTASATASATATATATSSPLPEVCIEALDVILVLDGSGSINTSEFNQMKTFASDVVSSFAVGPDDAHIGVVQFSGTSRGRVEIGLSSDATAVNNAITSMSQIYGSTDIYEAISLARTEFSNNGRSGIPKAIILLTDGAHQESNNPVEEAHRAEGEGITLLTVAVGNGTDPVMLRDIATDPDQHAFAVNEFADLTLLLVTLVEKSCITETPTPPPSTTSTPEPLSINGVEPDEGYTDATTSVEITGAAFSASPAPQVQLSQSGTTVDLSGVTASSTRSLEASVPAGLNPGTYDLTITNPDGESVTLANAFTVLARMPELVSVMPVVGYNDVDNEIHVRGSGFVDGVVLALGTTDLETTRTNGTSLRAIVPAGLPVGTYDLIVTNPGGGQDQLDDAYTLIDGNSNNDLFGYDHELWFNPEVPRAGETMQMGLFVHRQGGKAALQNVPVRFVRDAVDGTVLGDSTVPFLDPPTDVDSTTPINVTFPTSGTYTIYAIIDPDNEIEESGQGELNNVISRTLTVAAPSADTTVPVVQEIIINGGVNEPAQVPNITLDISALDPPPGSSGVEAVHIIEYIFNQGAQQWVPVAQSGWLPYEDLPSTYQWPLESSPGVHYIQVRAIDGANNISIGHARQVVNYQPSVDDIRRNATHVYRYSVEAGQQLTANVEVLSGDADLYVWPPRDDQSARVSNVADGDEQVFIPAAEISEGVYQIEVFGYTTASYRLQVTIEDAQTTAGLDQQTATTSGTDPNKTLPSVPLLPIDSTPSERQGLVPPPTTTASSGVRVYIPFINR